MTPQTTRPSFKLGVAMSGAATGGAYEAGVMDFLLEALSQWELNPEESTPWRVELTDLAGSSAGGITSTITVGALNSGWNPLPSNYQLGQAAPANNPLFSSWVKKVNYESVFSTDDLVAQNGNNPVVRSFLNSDFMDEIAREVIADHGEITALPQFCSDIRLSITSVNLTGVPYIINQFRTYSDVDAQLYMCQHGDWTTFDIVQDDTDSSADFYPYKLNIRDENRNGQVWERLIQSSIATAALPGALPSVVLSKPVIAYESRKTITPAWPEEMTNTLEYATMDGGVINNDPFDIVADQMKRHHADGLSGDGSSVWGSVLLIKPFPGAPPTPDSFAPPAAPPSAIEALLGLSSITRAQATFKNEWLSDSPAGYDRFMLIPKRDKPADDDIELATGTLFGFGGILDEEIRLHDFILGRYNCQEFLRNGFVVNNQDVQDNPIFHTVPSDNGFTPIIPLVGTASVDVQEPVWPSYSDADISGILHRVSDEAEKRVRRITEIYVESTGSAEDEQTVDKITDIVMKAVRSVILKALVNFRSHDGK